jgi:phage terminase small subunit
MAKAKAKKVPTEKNVKDSYLMPDGSMIDLDSYDWGKDKLTDKQKLFVVWFCMPQTEYYHQAMKAARKAGYTPKTAGYLACNLRRDPRIEKLIKQFEDAIGKRNLIDAAERFLQEKIIRADFDVRDFYKTIEYTNKIGETKKQLILKDMEELTPEQRLCIDGIDVKGQKGIMIYTLPDREKIRDSLIAHAKKENVENGDEEFDTETIAEIIKGNIQIKIKEINRNKEIMNKATGFVDIPKNVIEEE